MSDIERPEAANSPASGPTRTDGSIEDQFTAEVQTRDGLVPLAISFSRQSTWQLAYYDYQPGRILQAARNEVRQHSNRSFEGMQYLGRVRLPRNGRPAMVRPLKEISARRLESMPRVAVSGWRRD